MTPLITARRVVLILLVPMLVVYGVAWLMTLYAAGDSGLTFLLGTYGGWRGVWLFRELMARA
jgi:hypothetical protein